MKMTAYIITLRDLFFLEIAYWHIAVSCWRLPPWAHVHRTAGCLCCKCISLQYCESCTTMASMTRQAWLGKPEQTFHSTELKRCGSSKHAKSLPFFSSNKIAPSLWQLKALLHEKQKHNLRQLNKHWQKSEQQVSHLLIFFLRQSQMRPTHKIQERKNKIKKQFVQFG